MPDDAQLDLPSPMPAPHSAVALSPQSEAAGLMAIITRAASDPSVDVAKLEKLTEMYERITAGRAKATFDAELSLMQPKLPIVDRRGKIIIRDKNDEKVIRQSTPYALFEDINEAVMPILAQHGFAVSFRIGSAPDGKVRVTSILSHREGHREETFMDLQHDSTGSKNAVQATGSSVSYGKRYTMCALLNITTRNEDDDGAKGGNTPISDEQLKVLDDLIRETKSNLTKFLIMFKVECLPDLPAAQFENAKRILLEKKGAAK